MSYTEIKRDSAWTARPDCRWKHEHLRVPCTLDEALTALLQVTVGIYLITCDITWNDQIYSHCIVWDAWRRLVFTGGGDCSRRAYNGIAMLEPNEDGTELLRVLRHQVGLGNVHNIYVLYVRCKALQHTHAV